MGLVRVLNSSNRNPGPDASKAPPPFGDGLVTRRFRAKDEKPLPGDCDVAFLQSAYRAVDTHLKKDTKREHGGLLLGLELPAPNGGRTVLVVHALPGTNTEGSPVSLTFTQETWTEFDRLTEAYEKTGLKLLRVGWYHSHPRIAIFLSHWDLDVCQDFDRPTDVALVVDPVGNKGAFFVRGSAGYRPDSPQGFVEFCDLHPETIVSWENVTAVTSPAPLPYPPAPPVPPEPVPHPLPLAATASFARTPPVAGQSPAAIAHRRTIAAGIVAAIGMIGWGTTWANLQSANGQLDAGAEQRKALESAADRADAARAAAEQRARIEEDQRLAAETRAQLAEANQARLAKDEAAAQAKVRELERTQADDVREIEATLAKLKKRLGLPVKP